jgi:hypothetical protein
MAAGLTQSLLPGLIAPHQPGLWPATSGTAATKEGTHVLYGDPKQLGASFGAAGCRSQQDALDADGHAIYDRSVPCTRTR